MIRSRICSYIKIKIVGHKRDISNLPYSHSNFMACDLITLIFDTSLTTFPSKPFHPINPFLFLINLFLTNLHLSPKATTPSRQNPPSREKAAEGRGLLLLIFGRRLEQKVYFMWGSVRGRELWWYVSPCLWYVSPCLWYISPCPWYLLAYSKLSTIIGSRAELGALLYNPNPLAYFGITYIHIDGAAHGPAGRSRSGSRW